jgi:hypothetical protein
MSEDQPSGIAYTEKQTASMAGRYSRLKPVEPGDRCCHCQLDCDEEGFASGNANAYRINGHPMCSRSTCYFARMSEFAGRRDGCSCGRKRK